MPKRFTDSDKWKSPYLRGLKAPYKLLWLYINDECDHAGIWQVDIEVACIKIGEPSITIEGALLAFKDKIHAFENGEKWFLPGFIDFQYGVLNPENRAHNSVILILEKAGFYKKNKPLASPLKGAMDKDKDKDTEQDNGKKQGELFEKIAFDVFWNLYGKKVGDKEKLIKKWDSFPAEEQRKILDYLPLYIISKPDKQFRKDPTTFFNNKSWNDEIINPNQDGRTTTAFSQNSSRSERQSEGLQYLAEQARNGIEQLFGGASNDRAEI